ncbi:SCO2524 family protein [Nocardia altamirensis]|uniref:SCO2524 family protein n=1 Tax=Nocardia altamirensis TaxID=472158 RepID=UPI0008405833|nr:SCO2524 family protein [Nocardia altamirensis]
MRIQPRQQLLELWRSVLAACYDKGTWHWGGRDGTNSISDTEQLLCLLYPATEIGAFALDQPDDMADDIRAVLAPLGEATRIGGALVGVLEDYFSRHTSTEGEPIFAAGSYLRSADGREPSAEQYELEVVDAYSMSLTLCIAALRFLRIFKRFMDKEVRREAKDLSARIRVLTPQVSVRLTAAMTGLVRSFVVHTPNPKSAQGQAILGMLNQVGAADETVIDGIARRLDRVRVQMANDVKLGQTPDIDLADELLLFECGWSWGIDQKASPIDFVRSKIGDQPGYAASRPDLYFTIVALDGINDLTSRRTREMDLLNDEQRQLADALELRWDLTQRYWSTVARYGPGRWPLEDLPWRTSDGEESDYYTLAVSAMVLQDFVNRQATDELPQVVAVFDQLARRGRIISRLTSGDPAAVLHYPGVRVPMPGSADIGGGPPLVWVVPDFATMLLKRSLQAWQLSGDVAMRDRLMSMAELTMDHLSRRQIGFGAATGLWDDAEQVASTQWPGMLATEDVGPRDGAVQASWYLTERIVECLVSADRNFREPPLAMPSMISRAIEMRSEAEHLLNQEMLEVGDPDVSQAMLSRIEQQLDEARRLLNEQPATAFSLAEQALLQLYELAYARRDAMRS